jgi:hypothetical protein
MQFVNPLNNKIQVCIQNIYHPDKISKRELDILILHLYNNNLLKYSKKLSLRIVRQMSYAESCELLYTSKLEFFSKKNTENYTDIICLNMSLGDLKQLAKNNFISISNNKNFICNELVNLGYEFKDNENIIKNANINKMRISIVATNTINNNQLPLNILIKKFGINIYTHRKYYVYVPPSYIIDIEINIVNNNIKLTLTNSIEYLLQYKNLNTDKNILKLYPKYILDYQNLIMYIENSYSDINVEQPSKHNIIKWIKENCNNYANCSNKEEHQLLQENKVCVKNKFSDNYINSKSVVKLNDGNCYNMNDIKNLIKFDDVQEVELTLTDLEKQYISQLTPTI